jgi:RimJ/RimL family protein N-acetyltransferase
MGSFPTAEIVTERLELREFGPHDVALVQEVMAAGAPEALPPGAPSQSEDIPAWLSEGVQRQREEGAGVHLMMFHQARGVIVGAIGLFHADWEARSTEVGYGVRSNQRGQGYATEALAAVTRWALTAGGIQRVWLTANTDNVASVRVAEKAGFVREGTLRRAGMEEDGLHDQAIFSHLDDD